MGSGDHFAPGISEQLHMANVKETYPSSHKVNCILRLLEHKKMCTGSGYVVQTP